MSDHTLILTLSILSVYCDTPSFLLLLFPFFLQNLLQPFVYSKSACGYLLVFYGQYFMKIVNSFSFVYEGYFIQIRNLGCQFSFQHQKKLGNFLLSSMISNEILCCSSNCYFPKRSTLYLFEYFQDFFPVFYVDINYFILICQCIFSFRFSFLTDLERFKSLFLQVFLSHLLFIFF